MCCLGATCKVKCVVRLRAVSRESSTASVQIQSSPSKQGESGVWMLAYEEVGWVWRMADGGGDGGSGGGGSRGGGVRQSQTMSPSTLECCCCCVRWSRSSRSRSSGWLEREVCCCMHCVDCGTGSCSLTPLLLLFHHTPLPFPAAVVFFQ